MQQDDCIRLYNVIVQLFPFRCDQGISVFSVSFDFSQSEEGWKADFVDLPANAEDSGFYELKYSYTNLPANLDARKAIMLSGNNHSDDLFMFIKEK